MADELLDALAEKTKVLESLRAPVPAELASSATAFSH
jgi:hypothetical protein